MMSFANFTGGGMILLLGFFLRVTDSYDGLSVFSTMSEDEKKKWDTKKTGRYVSSLMFISGLILIIGGVLCSINIYPNASLLISWVLMVIILVAGLIYIYKSKRFK